MKEKEYKRHRGLEIGLMLNILAISISIICKELLGTESSNITNGIYILSFCLIVDWRRLLSSLHIRFSKWMGLVLLLQIYILFLGLLGDAPFLEAGKGLVYTVYVIAFMLALLTNVRNIDDEYFMKLIICVTAVLNLITFYMIWNGAADLSTIRVTRMNNGAERTTLSGIPLYYIAAFLSFKPKKYTSRIVLWAVLGIAIFNMFACDRRSIYISVMVYLVFWGVNKGKSVKKVKRSRMIQGVFAFLVLLIVLRAFMSVEAINTFVGKSMMSLQRGVETFLTGTGRDPSVSVRNMNRALALQDLGENTLLQWIFGRGYAYLWIDFPILEAYLDMGIVAGTLYVYLYSVMIGKNIFIKRKFSGSEMFVIFNLLAVVVSNFISGMPYGYTKYCPLIIFIYVIMQHSRNGQVRIMEETEKSASQGKAGEEVS